MQMAVRTARYCTMLYLVMQQRCITVLALSPTSNARMVLRRITANSR